MANDDDIEGDIIGRMPHQVQLALLQQRLRQLEKRQDEQQLELNKLSDEIADARDEIHKAIWKWGGGVTAVMTIGTIIGWFSSFYQRTGK